MAATPFASGKNNKIVLVLNEKRVEIEAKNWTVEENATEDEDDVCGEDRSRPQKVVNFYTMSIECFVKNAKLLKALIDYSKHLDLLTGPQESAIGMMIYPNDGSAALFEGREVLIGAWRYASGDRRSRSMTTIPIKVRYFEPVGA